MNKMASGGHLTNPKAFLIGTERSPVPDRFIRSDGRRESMARNPAGFLETADHVRTAGGEVRSALSARSVFRSNDGLCDQLPMGFRRAI